MKKLITFFAIAFTALQLFGETLIIRNNTNQRLLVEVWLKGVGFYLEPGQEIEVNKSRDHVDFNCVYGVAWVETDEDTTVEFNTDCYYVGETKFEYWNEY